MTEAEIRAIVRDEIANCMDDVVDDEDADIGLYIRTVVLSMLRQLGFAQDRLSREKQN